MNSTDDIVWHIPDIQRGYILHLSPFCTSSQSRFIVFPPFLRPPAPRDAGATQIFSPQNVGKSDPLETRTRKAAPSSLTVSFSVIHRLPFPSLHPTLLFLWPFYFTPIVVNPARSVGGILKAALLSVFSSPSLRCGPVLMYTSHFIEVCTL